MPQPTGIAISSLFIELGTIIVIMALLARVAVRFNMTPIPLYLLLGLILGEAGFFPVVHILDFIQIGAEIGVVLLLFMLGLEYTGTELSTSLRTGLPAGILDTVLGFAPGVIAAFLLGWGPLEALVFGGVTHNSSSGIISKLLIDMKWMGNRETPAVLSILVIEDLVMAVFLPLLAVLLVGEALINGVLSLSIAIVAVLVFLVIAIRYGERISRLLGNHSDEVVLLTVLGLTFLIAGMAQGLQISTAVGAFLVGIALSGQVADRARQLLSPLRDLFAATFFLFFSLQINPADIPPMLGLALVLAFVTALAKLYTGWWAARRIGVSTRGRWRAGALLIPHGEFSIVIANIGASAGLTPELLPLSATYVLIMAVLGPVVVRTIDPVVAGILRRRKARAAARADSS